MSGLSGAFCLCYSELPVFFNCGNQDWNSTVYWVKSIEFKVNTLKCPHKGSSCSADYKGAFHEILFLCLPRCQVRRWISVSPLKLLDQSKTKKTAHTMAQKNEKLTTIFQLINIPDSLPTLANIAAKCRHTGPLSGPRGKNTSRLWSNHSWQIWLRFRGVDLTQGSCNHNQTKASSRGDFFIVFMKRLHLNN